MPSPLEYTKAFAGALIGGLGAMYMGLSDGVLTAQEWVGVAQTTLTGFAVVWGLPNAPSKNVVSQQTVTTETKLVDRNGPDHRAEVNGL